MLTMSTYMCQYFAVTPNESINSLQIEMISSKVAFRAVQLLSADAVFLYGVGTHRGCPTSHESQGRVVLRLRSTLPMRPRQDQRLPHWLRYGIWPSCDNLSLQLLCLLCTSADPTLCQEFLNATFFHEEATGFQEIFCYVESPKSSDHIGMLQKWRAFYLIGLKLRKNDVFCKVFITIWLSFPFFPFKWVFIYLKAWSLQ